ncbi:helix-turn-helix domain-containing protein [Fodinisporobacter ferrooxydans]|uniref:Helix-turn-helix domain-containing protein n=1 Tax=Fodinisporobacter ferrooxydans TaxID=2901836 RepID=A0ABY4CM25_9BACL|nr:helix-turn-helix domain-containing protein [Alicyclobacillaceae bacterium MYW30-H2]
MDNPADQIVQRQKSWSGIGEFQQLLSDMYGNDIAVPFDPSVLQMPEKGVSNREAALIRWMFEYLQQNSGSGELQVMPSLPESVRYVWQFAWQAECRKIAIEELESSKRTSFPMDSLLKQLPGTLFPCMCMFLDVTATNREEGQLQTKAGERNKRPLPEWLELIQEIAQGYDRSCMVVQVSTFIGGILLPVKDSGNPLQLIEVVHEECRSWVDALLAEMYMDVKIGVSSIVSSADCLVQGMQEAIAARQIGELQGGKNGVFSFGRLGFQRILYNLHETNRIRYRESMLSCETYEALGQDLRETALGFFRNHLNISETARVMYMHRNSLLYRLDKIRELTGYDIRKFEDAVALWTALVLWKLDGLV